jgi:hypothetical protein
MYYALGQLQLKLKGNSGLPFGTEPEKQLLLGTISLAALNYFSEIAKNTVYFAVFLLFLFYT